MTSVPSPNPLPGEFSSAIIAASGARIDLGQGEREPIGQALRAGRDARAPVRPDVDVDEPAPEPGRGPQVAGEDRHGATEEVLLDPGQVHEVRGMDRDRCDVVLGEAGPERRQLGRRQQSAAPRGRVVDEDLDRAGADLVGAIDGLDHAVAEREVGAKASAIGKHSRHRTTCGGRARRGLAR